MFRISMYVLYVEKNKINVKLFFLNHLSSRNRKYSYSYASFFLSLFYEKYKSFFD